jgi:hypothetical protein
MPANATLIYNGRTGQFINALTGQTISGRAPSGFSSAIPVAKMMWKDWLAAHPQTMVMDLYVAGQYASGPTHPIEPAWPMPKSVGSINDEKVALVGTQQPVAILQDVIGPAPLNSVADGQPILIFRASATLPARALVRRVGDLRPKFSLSSSNVQSVSRHGRSTRNARKIPGMFVDADTGSTWSGDGVWLSRPAEFKGTKLATMPVDEDLDWQVMKYWYPELKLVNVPQPTSTALAISN